MNKLIPLTLAALGLATPAAAQITAFQHIILVIQENRTPDNLFQGLCTPTAANPTPCSIQPGPQQYNIQTKGWLDKTASTGMTDPHPVGLSLNYDVKHDHAAFLAMCDLDVPSNTCKMDGAAHVLCTRATAARCPTKEAFGYVDNSTGTLQPYLDLAKSYGWANYMFQTNQGPSLPAHQFLFAATSAPSTHDDHHGIFVASGAEPTGCAAPSTARAALIGPKGDIFKEVFPCFEHETPTDLLERAGISWRYYGVDSGKWMNTAPNGSWMAPNTIAHICNASNHKCQGTEWTSHLQFTPNQVLSDISTTCNLAGVSWVIPDALDSDHSVGTGGPSWVASIVNGVGNSKCTDTVNGKQVAYWDSTAIFVVWDDWGGWYDHEQPTIEAYPWGGYQMGFRVPLIVVSAYTPKGYIHNGKEDFGSFMRFIEHNFNIMEGALTLADARGEGDLTKFFSLGNAPRPFHTIKAPLPAQYFLTRKPSGLPVDDD